MWTGIHSCDISLHCNDMRPFSDYLLIFDGCNVKKKSRNYSVLSSSIKRFVFKYYIGIVPIAIIKDRKKLQYYLFNMLYN